MIEAHDAIGRSAMNKALWRIIPLFGLIGFFSMSVVTTLVLNAPLILAAAAGLDPTNVGYLVSLGGAFGVAAINTISQIGGFSAPFAWGIAKDATGSFQAGLITLSIIAVVLAGLLMRMRRTLRGRAARQVVVTA